MAAKKKSPATPDAPKKRKKSIHYKKPKFVGSTGGLSLCQLVELAISKKHPPMTRMERLGESSDNVRVINAFAKFGTMVVGQFLDYTHGGAQAVLNLDPKADELVIEELPPADKRQYLEGILTFGIQGDHLLLIQSKGLRAAHFENHLNWLLREAKVVAEGFHVSIGDVPPADVKLKLKGVDSVELFAPVSVANFLKTEQKPNGVVGELVSVIREAISLKGSVYEDMKPEDALALKNFELSVRVGRTGRGKKRHGPSLVDEIAHTLRNVDDAEFVLEMESGTRISSKQLKQTANLDVEVTPGGRIILASAAEVMQGWLSSLVAHKQV